MNAAIDIWLIPAALTLLLVPLAGACLCYAIGADASARGASGLGWCSFAFVLAPIAVPAYLLYRRRLPARGDSAGRTERWIGAFGIGAIAAYAVGAIVAPPDPISLVIYTIPLIAIFVPLATRVYAPKRRGIST
ncbi:hypothetical protein [Natronorubrum halophilum]|uniref:hypothetical protein n=1 Tax=Natronorubrum halophilum TaxID=1702106 RepID=UPI000EF7553B|nr:hypothetical protein [Natronorubrum halophilum]